MFDNNEEMFPIVDEEGNITGAATRKECHSGSKYSIRLFICMFSTIRVSYIYKNVLHGKIFSPINGTLQLEDILT